jgi:hypothetical protein
VFISEGTTIFRTGYVTKDAESRFKEDSGRREITGQKQSRYKISLRFT